MAECLECKTTNPQENRYCGKCGAELGHTLDETVRKKDFRDRQAIEFEIAEKVAERLLKWGKWIGEATAVVVILFAGLLGWKSYDLATTVSSATSSIQGTATKAQSDLKSDVQTATTEIQSVSKEIPALSKDIAGLRSNVERYKQTNDRIDDLQKRILSVQSEVIDLGKKTLKIGKVDLISGEPFLEEVGRIGCPSTLESNYSAGLCLQAGTPPFLTILSPNSPARAVASVSPFGFQDVSTTSKPACGVTVRGTFFVEKGAGGAGDKAFLCARKSDNTYVWIPLISTP